MIFIVGPTATGKTQTGIELAKKINGEIVSADSRQIYKYLSIGTAKPKGKWKKINNKKFYIVDGIPYHLVDFLDPKENFSAGEFVDSARKIINEIKERGKIPIIVGGTGLYINSLINGIAKLPPRDNALREKLLQYEKKFGRGYLYKILKKVDPESAKRIHPNNIHRIIRAIEVFELTKIPISEWHKRQKQEKKQKNEDNLIFGLTCPRNLLYERINNRVEAMLKDGLIEETKFLLDKSYPDDSPGLKSIGYKYVIQHIKNLISYQEMERLIKQETRHYAKRQITWFKKTENVEWLDCSKNTSEEISKYIYGKSHNCWN